MSGDDKAKAFAETVATDSGVTLAAVSGLGAAVTTDLGAREVLAGRWEILGLIGSGGMGTVYRARDRELDEDVALKVLRAEVLSPADLERFLREVKLSRKVTHKNVARVFELAEHGGRRFFTMELVEGESLRGHLERSGRLSVDAVVGVGVAVCRGLAAAHDEGVIHRDLKPDNVLVSKGGRIAITDFGIASSLERGSDKETSAFVGTPHYMAPEQVEGSKDIDGRADIYALGVMLFELAVGTPPFEAKTPLAVAALRLTKAAPDPKSLRPDLPDGLARIINKCLRRDPGERYATAAEVEAALLSETASGSAPSVMPPAPLSTAEVVVTSIPAHPPMRGVRIAVLPMANVGLGDDAYLAEGVTEDLIDALSAMQGLRVAAYGSVVALGGDARDPREAGKQLGVEVVAQGSLRRIPADRLRLTVRLSGVQDGIQLWVGRFDFAAAELLDINEEVARALAQAVAVKVPPPDRKLTDPIAIDLYLRARAKYREFWREGVLESVRFYELALERAPDAPLLVAGHALALARAAFFSAASLPDANAAAARALALAPELGEAHLAAGAVAMQESRIVDAYKYGLAAIARAPSLAEAHQLLGRILAETGPIEEAARALDFAAGLDPASGVTRRERIRLLALAGKWDEAFALLDGVAPDESLDRVGMMVVRLRLELWRGNLAALDQVRTHLGSLGSTLTGTANEFPIFLRAVAESIAQRRPFRLEELTAMTVETGSSRRLLFFHQLAIEANTLFGSMDHAIETLRSAVDKGLMDLVWLDHCPALSPIRETPTFIAARTELAERARGIHLLIPR
jgi:serine/threonine-protein kinase